jgi:hypothetical protein
MSVLNVSSKMPSKGHPTPILNQCYYRKKLKMKRISLLNCSFWRFTQGKSVFTTRANWSTGRKLNHLSHIELRQNYNPTTRNYMILL